MDDLEIIALNKLDFKPLFFYRYVEDIIMCEPDVKIIDMLEIFNSINTNLRFTKEIEDPQNGMNYLDITIYRFNNGIISD